jgi:uncharacterized membrane protein YfcA
MKQNNNFSVIYLLSIVITFIGVFSKIKYIEHGQLILIIGVLLTLAYMILGIKEVNKSTRIKDSEKIMWTVGFIFFGFVTGLVYLLSGRKRIV